MKLDKLLNEKLHKHQFEVAKEKIGRVNFTGIAGGVKENVRVKAVLEKCTIPGCNKTKSYVVDGSGSKYPMDARQIWG
jgi:hypothetical protein